VILSDGIALCGRERVLKVIIYVANLRAPRGHSVLIGINRIHFHLSFPFDPSSKHRKNSFALQRFIVSLAKEEVILYIRSLVTFEKKKRFIVVSSSDR
jgi:hypothetical protein